MATAPLDELNPFRAPTAAIGVPTLGGMSHDVESIRLAHLKREASVRSVGMALYLLTGLGVLGSGLYGFFGIAMLVKPIPQPADLPLNLGIMMLLGAGLGCLFSLLYAGWGYGLRRLHVWARWLTAVLAGIGVLVGGGMAIFCVIAAVAMNQPLFAFAALVYVVPGLIAGYVLSLMLGAKASMVFSDEYREVIRQTPYLRYKTSLPMKILLGLLVGLIAFLVIAALVNGVQ